MSACNFTIPFVGSAETILQKAKTAVESQGGSFTGDEASGNFDVSVFGNTIAGSYSVAAQSLDIVINSKPILVPCSTIESFLTKQLN
jgi:hypothetical protein